MSRRRSNVPKANADDRHAVSNSLQIATAEIRAMPAPIVALAGSAVELNHPLRPGGALARSRPLGPTPPALG